MDPVYLAQWEMIEAGGRTAQSFGLNRLFGQIYMLLYLSPASQCLDELARQLGVSKASVSIAARQMESWGAVRRTWVRGDRRDYYQAETDLRHILHNGLLASVRKKFESARIQIERSLSFLDQAESSSEQVRFLRRQLKEAESYRAKAERLLKNPLVRRLF